MILNLKNCVGKRCSGPPDAGLVRNVLAMRGGVEPVIRATEVVAESNGHHGLACGDA
jgi:hypothetical protein